ncbi:MAG: class I SAM-dependent methyltransferase [Gammaproteobacteria bacterium]|nr:MAG: SAM-dependent methyltransferase [Gammaproteobacteria bacterium]
MSTGILNYTKDLRDYLWDKGIDEHPALKELRIETAGLPESMMQICPEQGALMGNLIRMISAKRTIEVGTFTGYSALVVALALPEDGEVIACDVSEEWTAIGKERWEQAGVSHKIDLRLGPAVDTLDELIQQGQEDSFDFAFIDADKVNYTAYYEKCLHLIASGGVIAIDNVLWGGSVLDSKRNDEDTKAIRELNDFVALDERVNISMIPIGDGVTLVVKK